MASARTRRRALRQSRLETRVRYGPETRGLAELAAENRDTLDFSVNAARGTAAGITQAIREASPITKRVFDRAEGSLGDVYSDVPTEGMGGLMSQVAARERAQAFGHVEEGRADALADLQSRKVSAEEGRAYAVQNAIAQFREGEQKIGRQRQGLAGDKAAFRLGAFQDIMNDEQQLALERRRIRISAQSERRQQRATEADITGIDPATGLPTAGEQNRRRDDVRADAEAKDKGGKGKLTAGEKTKHQGIVAEIQEAAAVARRARKGGAKWSDIGYGMTQPKDKDNPNGGYGQLVTRAAIELGRSGKISQSTMRALKARGFFPRRAPAGWRQGGRNRVVEGGRDRVLELVNGL